MSDWKVRNCKLASKRVANFITFISEAFAFIKKPETISTETFDEKRKKLKLVIKSKIRKAKSDQRKNEKFSKKRKV